MTTFGFGRAKEALFPTGRVGYAVGDIHGRADLLARMLDRLETDPRSSAAPPVVVFLGDYIDRGPDSAEVIELLLTGRPEGFEKRFLKGNHEEALLNFYTDPVAAKAWLGHGGLQTLGAYGVQPLPSLGASSAEITRVGESFRAKLPDAHLRFFNRLERYVTLGDYAFVHAGIDPQRRLDAQADSDLLWIRRRFLESDRRATHVVVHGHTPADQPYRDRRRVGLDTGAYFTGVLTAARFEDDSVTFLEVR
jgi:serine/threonine protein phosphatase 1